MSTRHEDNDGSDIFWPGYVDATTNLILNLLFLLTILIVAVFMFALELGRSTPAESNQQVSEMVSPATSSPVEIISLAKIDFSQEVSQATADFSESASLVKADSSEVTFHAATNFSQAVAIAATGFSAAVSSAINDSVAENMALKNEIQRLNTLLAQRQHEPDQSGGLINSAEATSRLSKPKIGLDKIVATDLEVVVRFTAEAVEFTAAERELLIDSLQPIVARGKTSLYVEVPAGFSEAKRMGFYRAMAVRNLLIEMELSQENIDVLVIEGKNNANASLVRVMSR